MHKSLSKLDYAYILINARQSFINILNITQLTKA